MKSFHITFFLLVSVFAIFHLKNYYEKKKVRYEAKIVELMFRTMPIKNRISKCFENLNDEYEKGIISSEEYHKIDKEISRMLLEYMDDFEKQTKIIDESRSW